MEDCYCAKLLLRILVSGTQTILPEMPVEAVQPRCRSSMPLWSKEAAVECSVLTLLSLRQRSSVLRAAVYFIGVLHWNVVLNASVEDGTRSTSCRRSFQADCALAIARTCACRRKWCLRLHSIDADRQAVPLRLLVPYPRQMA